MRLHRCLLIACGTLCQACDSKLDSTPLRGSGDEPAPPRIELAGDALLERLFAQLAPTTTRFVLAPDLTLHFAIPAGGTTVNLARDGTISFGALGTRLDEPGKNALRAALGEVRSQQVDIVVDRSQTVRTLIELVRVVQPMFPTVRIASGVPTGPTRARIIANDQTVIRDNFESIRRCVNHSLTSDGPTTGYKLELAYTVDANGAVVGAAVSSSPGVVPPLSECLTKAALTWKVKVAAGKYTTPIEVKAE
jgi:hypothetical protein